MNPTNPTTMTPSPTNPTSAPSESSGDKLNIQPNNFYRTRDGRKVRVYATDGSGVYPIHGAIMCNGEWGQASWTEKGAWTMHGQDSTDLIAEWSDKPEIDWSRMPAWAKGAAFGPSGWLYYFSERPTLGDHGWKWAEYSGIVPPYYAPKWSGDWRDSLVIRPDAETEVAK